MMHFTGIDVGKDKLDIGWLRDAVSHKKKSKVVNNTTKGHQQVIDWLLTNTQAKADDIIVTIEPTGIYHEALIYALHDKASKFILLTQVKQKNMRSQLTCCTRLIKKMPLCWHTMVMHRITA